MRNDIYNCSKCKEEWSFYPQDYENPWEYPTKCPLCSMSVFQMIKDVYEVEGIIGVFQQISKRFLSRNYVNYRERTNP